MYRYVLLAKKRLRPQTLRARLISASLVLIAAVLTVTTLFPSGASAAIAFRDVGTGNNAGGNTTLDVSKPATVALGDIMVAIVSVRGGTGTTITAPSGWNLLNETSSTTVLKSGAFYKKAVSGEPSAYTFTFNATQKASGTISAYSGVDSVHQVHEVTSQANTSSATLTAPALTTVHNNTMLVAGYSTATGTTMTAGSSMTLRGQAASTGGSAGTRTTTGIQDLLQVSAGASGTKNMTAGASAVNVGHLLALRPKLDMKMSAYRWFANADSTTPGSALAAQNTQASIAAGTARLQMLTHIQDGSTSPHHGVQLRYATRGADNVCDASGTNETYQAISNRAKTKSTFGSTAVNDTGTGQVAWSNPSGGLVSDFITSTATLTTSNPASNYLKITGFGFNIPTGATIHDVSVTASAYPSYYSPGLDETMIAAKVVKAGTIMPTGSESIPLATTSTSNYVRFAPSLYGTTFTPSDINNSGFGVALATFAELISGNITTRISSVNVQVTYSDGGTMKTVNNASPVDGATPVNGGLTHGADNIVPTAYSESDTSNFIIGESRQTSGDLLFDFALDFSSMSPGVYCLMAYRDDGTALGATHDVVPQITLLPPTVAQANYRWFANANSVTPGAPLVAQDTSTTVATETPVRLRQRLAVDTAALSASEQNYKLQYAEKSGVCDVGFSGETYADMYAPGSTLSVSTAGVSRTVSQVDNPSGTESWSSISNAAVSDNNRANVGFAGVGYTQSEYLAVGGDMPSIPAGAIITGIRIGVEGLYNLDSSANAHLALDGTIKGSAQNTSMSTLETLVYTGGSSDLWGTTWTAAEINAASSFQVYIFAELYDSFGPPSVQVDDAFAEVYYTVPSAQPIMYYNNATPADNATISSTASDPTNGARPTVYQKYRETDPFTNSVAAIPSGSDGIWDFALTGDPSAAGKTYCLRVVKSNNSLLDTYSYIPEITFTSPGSGPTLDQQLRGGQSMQNGVKTPLNW